MEYILVFLGGGLGAGLRYWVQGVIHGRTGAGFPFGTLAVNLLGSFAIGLLATALAERFPASPYLRLFLLIGVLGGFTTFSSFSYETLALLRDGESLRGLTNIGASVLGCLAAAWAGLQLGQWI